MRTRFVFPLLLTTVLFASVLNHVRSEDNFQDALSHVKTKKDSITQKKAVEELLRRIIPARANEFIINIDPDIAPAGKDAFTLLNVEDGKIQVTGSSGVAATWGFNHYLKYSCKAHISWETQQLNLPNSLPKIKLKIVSNDRFRYYQNVCTSSYSFAWWSWSDWEKHIDWMAMNGFNFVLAFTGQEAIWQRVYKKLNMIDEEINEHFGGPAFLAWARMGNLRGWGGPLTPNWHQRSLVIQKAILERMRNLGIVPISPAFAGHVPLAFKRLFPDAKMSRIEAWGRFDEKYCCPYLLDPTDLLFNKIGRMFLQEQINEYGTDHVYNCDTFNEMNPSTVDPKYLGQISQSIFAAMTGADTKAIWVLQGWLFHFAAYYWTKPLAKAFITAVPKGRMIVLDLYSEVYPQYDRLDSYFGQPYIWCMLHNFGGTLGMFGSIDIINTRVMAARKAEGSTMIGTGITMEGINQNYAVYDFMTEQAWRNTSADTLHWFNEYATRRYGKENNNATDAWKIFKDTVLSYSRGLPVRGKYVIVKSPRLGLRPWFWYNTTEFALGWNKLLDAADDLQDNDGYRHDVVDSTRQILQIVGDVYFTDLVKFFRKKNADQLKELIDRYNELFIDLERILASDKAFLLGNWLESAKAAANNTAEMKLYEFNARNQITLWGPKGEVKDYAAKQWAGLVSHYYSKRWKLFMNEMYSSVVNSTPFKENEVTLKIFTQIEKPFTIQTDKFPTESKGNSIEIARDIYSKWHSKVKLGRIEENN